MTEIDEIKSFYVGSDLIVPKPDGDNDSFLRGDYDEKFVPYNLAKLMDIKFFFYTDPITKELYVWKNGVFEKAEGFVEKIVEANLKEKTSKNKTTETQFCLLHLVRPEIQLENIDLIAVENGFYSIQNKKLIPFSPIFFNKIKLPVKFNPDADCLKWKKFLKEVVNEQNILLLQEIFGYCLLRDYRFHKVFIMLGGGRNGKGVTLNVLKKLIGQRNVSHVSLQALEQDKFAAARLYEKMANIYPDLSSDSLSQISMMKSTSGQDEIDGENKYGFPFAFTNYAKHIISCNVLPPIYEDTEAVFNRIILIDYPNTFDKKTAIPNLVDQLTTPEELSGIFNWALEGLYRLLDKNDFTYSSLTEDTRMKYVQGSDPVKFFCLTFLEKDQNSSLPKSSVYDKYISYCEDNGFKSKHEDVFFKGLKRSFPLIETTQKMFNNQKIRYYEGIKFKDIPENLDLIEKETFEEIKKEEIVIKDKIYEEKPLIFDDLGAV